MPAYGIAIPAAFSIKLDRRPFPTSYGDLNPFALAHLCLIYDWLRPLTRPQPTHLQNPSYIPDFERTSGMSVVPDLMDTP